MKNSKKDFGFAGQSTTEAKKSQKHDANLQKNSTLYFQIGLILCLLGTYALFEMQFQEKKIDFIKDETAQIDPLLIDYVPPFIEEVIEPKTPEPAPSVKLIDKVKVVENDVPVIKTIIKTENDPIISKQPVKVGDINVIEEPTELDDIPFIAIEKVPVYPGCEKYDSNNKRKKCMSERISKLINNKFNTNIGYKYGLSGRQRIHTQFTIDKNGDITDIKIKGSHIALEKEANRVINKLPKMEPGLQRNVPVGVIYTLPIMFEIRN